MDGVTDRENQSKFRPRFCTCSHVPKSALKILRLGISYAPSEMRPNADILTAMPNIMPIAMLPPCRTWTFARKRLAEFSHHRALALLLHRRARDAFLLHLRTALPQFLQPLTSLGEILRYAASATQTHKGDNENLQAALQYHRFASSELGGQPIPTSVKYPIANSAFARPAVAALRAQR